jgi:Mg-chelatase subunit ChlD
MPFSLETPLWLLALAAVWLVVSTGRRTVPAGDRSQRRATVVRAVGVAALVLALAGPRWEAAGRGMDVVVVVDASDSTASARGEVEPWLAAARSAVGGGDRLAVAAVGRDAQVEHGLRADPPGGGLSVRVDGTETDLARGLRLAQGLAGSEQRRRVVLLTDGLATRGDAPGAVRELEEAGIPLDVVTLGRTGASDVLVEGVRAPSMVRSGDAYDVTVALTNTASAPAAGELVLTADGEEVHREAVTLPPGRSEVRIPRVATDREGGSVRYEARLRSAASTEERNDRGVAAVQIEGPASVLVVDGRAGEAAGGSEELVRLLEAGGLPVEVHDGAGGFPRLDELLGHDATVLVDVHADTVGEVGAVALDAYVRDAGRGLVVVGGEQAYGPGGYDGTRLEELLPVFARIQDPQRRPSVAQALVVDVSGSMAACHCRPDGFAGGPSLVEGGPNKTDISREAVARAIANLDAQDTVGVLAFHTEAEWVLPLQALPPQAVVDDALARLHPDGDTSIGVALREAIDGLRDADARLRHVVLFSDGFTEERGLEDIAAEALDAGITVSVVGTGEGAGDVLERMAEAGGGRYYPGRDLSQIPAVLASEVQMVSRPLIAEGRFTPIVSAADEITDRLGDRSPPLLGYVATSPKPTARTLLRIGDERDPLLSTWQAGLGTVTAWTSDAAPRWSSPWLGWDGARELWGAVVRATLPTHDANGVEVSADMTADGLRLEVTSGGEALPGDVTATAVIVAPSGERTEVALQRSDLDRFEALTAAGGDGVHAVTIRVERGGVELTRRTVTAVRSYPAEYAAPTGGPEAAAALVGEGGRLDPDPEALFTREGTTPGRTPRDLTPWLLVLALLTLPLDVGLRRLRLERGDLRRLWHRSSAVATTSGGAPSRSQELAARRTAERAERRRGRPAGADPGVAEAAGGAQADGDQAGSEQAGRAQAGRDLTGRDQTGRDQTGRDQTGREQAGGDRFAAPGSPPPPTAAAEPPEPPTGPRASRLLEARRRARRDDGSS